METTSDIKLLDSLQCKEHQESQASNLLPRNQLPHLRLVVSNEEPRKCAQSTSERSSSHVTLVADSRSISIAKDSPHGLNLYAMLRRWPAVVPHRLANASRSEADMVFKKSFNSMPDYHHMVIHKATPDGVFTNWCKNSDNPGMANPTAPIRRANLQRLIDLHYDGNQSAFAREAYPENESANYVNDLLRVAPAGQTKKLKPFGETAARTIEARIGLFRGELDIPNSGLRFEKPRAPRLRDQLLEMIQEMDSEDEQLEALDTLKRIRARRQPKKKTA